MAPEFGPSFSPAEEWIFLVALITLLIILVLLAAVVTAYLAFLVGFATAFVLDLENKFRAAREGLSARVSFLFPATACIVSVGGIILGSNSDAVLVVWPLAIYTGGTVLYAIYRVGLIWYNHPLE